jgi:hypothetical protein
MEKPLSLDDIKFKTYEKEEELTNIIKLVETELSEPYSIFTYRYFLQKWPHLCIMVLNSNIWNNSLGLPRG